MTLEPRKLILTSRVKKGTIMLDIRLSHGYALFDDLPPAAGFPRALAPDESIEINLETFSELLYKRSTSNSTKISFWLHKVTVSPESTCTKAYICGDH